MLFVAFVCFIGFLVFIVGGAFLILLWGLWPSVLGVIGGIAFWLNGADNFGVMFALASFAGQYFWNRHQGLHDSDYDPMSEKRKHYDANGKLRGYSDRD